MIDVSEVRDFSKDYTFEDFRELVKYKASTGLINEGPEITQDGLGFAAMCLYYDYKYKRANAFGYLKWNMLARTMFEFRKTAILQIPAEYLSWFNEDTTSDIVIKNRIDVLETKLEDYRDDNWQYFWATWVFIPKQKREFLEYTFEEYLEDGNPERDVYVDPLWNLRAFVNK